MSLVTTNNLRSIVSANSTFDPSTYTGDMTASDLTIINTGTSSEKPVVILNRGITPKGRLSFQKSTSDPGWSGLVLSVNADWNQDTGYAYDQDGLPQSIFQMEYDWNTGATAVYTISSISTTVDGVSIVTTTTPQSFRAGDSVVLAGTNSTPSANGTVTVVTAIDNTHFTFDPSSDITIAATTGTATGVYRQSEINWTVTGRRLLNWIARSDDANNTYLTFQSPFQSSIPSTETSGYFGLAVYDARAQNTTIPCIGVTKNGNLTINQNADNAQSSGIRAKLQINNETLLTGTVSITAGTAAVTGTGTLFTQQLVAGEYVTIGAETISILTVNSDTSITLLSNHSAGASNVSIYSSPSNSIYALGSKYSTGGRFDSNAGTPLRLNYGYAPNSTTVNLITLGLSNSNTYADKVNMSLSHTTAGTTTYFTINNLSSNGGFFLVVGNSIYNEFASAYNSFPKKTYIGAGLAPGTLKTNATAVGNIGSGEDDLISYTVSAALLATTLDSLEIEAWGTFASNANSKQVKLKFGSTELFATSSQAQNGGSWMFRARVVRTGASTQDAIATFYSNGSLFTEKGNSNFTTPTENLNNTVIIKCVATGVSDNDIICEGLHVKMNHGQ